MPSKKETKEKKTGISGKKEEKVSRKTPDTAELIKEITKQKEEIEKRMEDIRQKKEGASTLLENVRDEIRDLGFSETQSEKEKKLKEKEEKIKQDYERFEAEEAKLIEFSQILEEQLETFTKIKEFFDMYRALFLPLGEHTAAKTREELVNLIKILLNELISGRENLEKELNQLSVIRSNALYREYRNLTKAGFDEDKAWQWILTKSSPLGIIEIIKSFPSVIKIAPEATAVAQKIKKQSSPRY